MILTQRSKTAGNSDGSFSYAGFAVAPHVPDSDKSGVTVYTGNDEMHFESWRAAKEWIAVINSYGE